MTHHILISDRQTRHLSDQQLLTRLRCQVLAGIEAGGNTCVVGGHHLPRLYDLDPTDMLWALRHPRGQHVKRHDDGSVDVTLTTGIEVNIHPVHAVGGSR